MVDRANEEVQHRWKTLHKEISWADVEPEAAAVLEFVRDREPLPWVLGPRGRTLSDAELAEIRERKDKIGRAVNRPAARSCLYPGRAPAGQGTSAVRAARECAQRAQLSSAGQTKV